MTEEHVADQAAAGAARRVMTFAKEVDEIALILAGQSPGEAQAALDVVITGLQDQLDEDVLNLLLEAVALRKMAIDRGVMPVQ